MAGVYCPTCESGVEASAKFCLACGHDLTGQGPITSTGHDLNQLKDVIRMRDDLSMAEKFDMIAKVEEGANPIQLGIAAGAGDEGVDIGDAFAGADDMDSLSSYDWGQSKAANAAVKAVVEGTSGWDLIQAGKLNLSEDMFRDAMNSGMQASTHIHDVAKGAHEGIDPEAMSSIPVLKPPKRSFCPKCGSDIHSNTMLQWRKWRDSSGDVVSMQMEAAMETALIHIASHYINSMQALKDERDDALAKLGKMDKGSIEEKLREKIEKEIRKELKAELKDNQTKDSSESKKSSTTKKTESKKSTKTTQTKAKSKPKKSTAGGLFGKKTPTKKYEGEPGGKVDWFLENALDTVYDPHGTGKVLKPATILARSTDGNVRVRDVIRIYGVEGKDGISELAWTSPQTKYLIEAYDAC